MYARYSQLRPGHVHQSRDERQTTNQRGHSQEPHRGHAAGGECQRGVRRRSGHGNADGANRHQLPHQRRSRPIHQ